MADAQEYILGTHDEEVARLSLQHQLWAGYTTHLWERAGFQAGWKVLDVGCGPGYAALDLARLVGPQGRVLAIDESQRFLSQLEAQSRAGAYAHVEARLGDVQNLEVAPASMDGAYARWVLCWVRDPLAVVRGVARALKRGGIFAIQDYFNYRAMSVAPRKPEFDMLLAAILKAWRDRNGDDDLAGRLPQMLVESGFEVLEIRPVLRVARAGDPILQWPTSFFRSFVPSLVKTGYLTGAQADAFFRVWEELMCDPQQFFSTPPVYEIIARRV